MPQHPHQPHDLPVINTHPPPLRARTGSRRNRKRPTRILRICPIALPRRTGSGGESSYQRSQWFTGIVANSEAGSYDCESPLAFVPPCSFDRPPPTATTAALSHPPRVFAHRFSTAQSAAWRAGRVEQQVMIDGDVIPLHAGLEHGWILARFQMLLHFCRRIAPPESERLFSFGKLILQTVIIHIMRIHNTQLQQ